ncbi:diguanylate cyclase [Baekduia soli]|uniref:Diguanylate cyclase n=1 Tax=Baekduia soli TaxID=496014 RepID=A0A5B8UBT0_9ACTN|nr:diguanylate cyclase [Baekduia soli]QEC50467.1 diguanylate cyclase [Baekduia soli]
MHTSVRLSRGLPSITRSCLAVALAVAVADALAGRATLAIAGVDGLAPVWPPAAIALTALLWRGLRLWPAVLAGVVAAELLAGAGVLAGLGWGLADTAQAVLTVTLLGRLGADARCPRQRDAVLLLVCTAAAATVTAPLGSGILAATGHGAAGWPRSAVVWGLGDVLGVVLLTPALLGLVRPGRGPRAQAAAAERTVAALALAALLAYAATDAGPSLWVPVPVMMWIALRQGITGAGLAGLGSALAVCWAAAHGIGRYDGSVQDVAHAQLVIGMIAVLMAMVAAATAERLAIAADLTAIAAEDGALRRVATTVAAGVAPGEALEAVACEMARLLDVHTGVVVRFEGGRDARVLALWSQTEAPQPGVGELVTIVPDSAVDRARLGEIGRFDERDAETLTLPPFRLRIAAPILADGRPWGALIACSVDSTDLPAEIGQRLARFAELAGLAVQLAAERDRLVEQASSDPLTGLLNHRAFHERLVQECARARRAGRPLSLAIFDLDRFKQVNDTLGHLAGDAVLAEAARRMADATRDGEIVARIGGDELALLMPDTASREAHAAGERVRRAIGAEAFEGAGTLTVSAGVCDLEEAADADELLRLADGALYWAKAHGRDACIRYSPEVVEELSATERAERLEHARALAALGALAKAIDAKDPATIRHSERVAALAAELAAESGWAPAAVRRLYDAALVHDVGKIGVPDAVLSKQGRLTDGEYDVIKRHADLGARIVAGVLDPDQVAWVRGHHERHDGGGYPDGLAGEDITEGARLLALADAWDAMTGARIYSAPMPVPEAMEEVRRGDARQFHPAAVAALERVHARGGLGVAEAADEPVGVAA